ncbi:MAG: NlpC/P60 family protein [Proteobacteria bacterium]|nr:NlpC/P60 family protein [Pseudomonadota bacterium]
MVKITEQQIIEQARTWLGTKYHHQGRLKKSARGFGGVDCIGLVIGIIDELGIQDGDENSLVAADETNYSMYPEQGRLVSSIQKHLREVPKEQMRVGDVLLFKTFKDPQHVGLLSEYPSGGVGLIHCNSSAGKVVEQPLAETWMRMLTHVYRFKNKQLKSIK